MLASDLAPGAPRADEHLARLARGTKIAIAATTMVEITYGLRRGIEDGNPGLRGPLAWWRATVAANELEILPMTAAAAVMTGEVRGVMPFPPSIGRKRRGGKPDVRVAWVNDIEIACTAWAHGRAVHTSNGRDFETIREVLARLAPGVPPLELVAVP